MQYIILDMEWNQAWSGFQRGAAAAAKPDARRDRAIGAVRMSEDQEIAMNFRC